MVSAYKSCAELLKAQGINPKDTRYNEAFTALKKLGIILKHDNRYLLNPLVDDKATSRRYELAINYYNILFEDLAFEFTTVDQFRDEAVSLYMADLQQLNQRIEDANYIYELTGEGEYRAPLQLKSFQEYYDIAFCSLKPNSLYGAPKAIWKAVNETYRYICGQYITRLLLEHIYMMEEQGIVRVEWAGRGSKTLYYFNKLTLKLQKTLISYDQTKYYLDNLPTPDEELAQQLFADTQQELQQQFEEEDSTDETTMTQQQPITLYPNLSVEERPCSSSSRTRPIQVDEYGIEIPIAFTEQEISEALCGGGHYQLPKVRKIFCMLPKYDKTAQQLKDEGQLDEEALLELEQDLQTNGHLGKERNVTFFPYHYASKAEKEAIQRRSDEELRIADEINKVIIAKRNADREEQHRMNLEYYKNVLCIKPNNTSSSKL